MPPKETYSFTLEPIYEPSPEAPEVMVGQVRVEEEPARRAVCRVEVRAQWAEDGDVTVGTPDPPDLPGLSQEEIQQRARALATLLRDDKLSGRQGAGGDPSEP
ncbi:MAG: hypothetical protein JO250_00635 [Armatimonadetes bacterium]|nr:hypothetical protein [Armatimonadota bacterium]